MLIWRKGEYRVESDGYISSDELTRLSDLRMLDEERAQDVVDQTARLAARARDVKRRAWRRGYASGRAAALREFVQPATAAAFAARCLQERLAQIALEALCAVIGELPPTAALPNQMRRCIAASRSQRVMSVRVSAEEYEGAVRFVAALQQELGVAPFAVLADAGLPPRSCVIETEEGVIDGSLKLQLVALERGMRDAVGALLDEYTYLDDGMAKQFLVIENGLLDTIDALSHARPTSSPPTRNEHGT
jgi:type III secretion protein L